MLTRFLKYTPIFNKYFTKFQCMILLYYSIIYHVYYYFVWSYCINCSQFIVYLYSRAVLIHLLCRAWNFHSYNKTQMDAKGYPYPFLRPLQTVTAHVRKPTRLKVLRRRHHFHCIDRNSNKGFTQNATLLIIYFQYSRHDHLS